MHFSELQNLENHRHVLGISGGKDSAALAVYIKDRYPELSEKIEYFFARARRRSTFIDIEINISFHVRFNYYRKFFV